MIIVHQKAYNGQICAWGTGKEGLIAAFEEQDTEIGRFSCSGSAPKRAHAWQQAARILADCQRRRGTVAHNRPTSAALDAMYAQNRTHARQQAKHVPWRGPKDPEVEALPQELVFGEAAEVAACLGESAKGLGRQVPHDEQLQLREQALKAGRVRQLRK